MQQPKGIQREVRAERRVDPSTSRAMFTITRTETIEIGDINTVRQRRVSLMTLRDQLCSQIDDLKAQVKQLDAELSQVNQIVSEHELASTDTTP
jgi:hypothetical protein